MAKIDNLALIIGAMKAGTTSLFNFLAQHPEVAPCSLKEPHFFTWRWKQGAEWYWNLWDGEPGMRKVALEASTSYAMVPTFPHVIERLGAIRARLKFIYILRDPIERLESQYTHMRMSGDEVMALEDGIDPHLIATSKYAMQIDHYMQAYRREDMLLLDFEQLKTDPRGLLAKVCRFLEIDPAFELNWLGVAHNTTHGRLVVEHPLYRKWKRLPLLPRMVEKLPRAPKQMVRNLLLTPFKGNDKLSPEQRKELSRELHEDLCKLSSDYGFDISGWDIDFEPSASARNP